MIVIIVASVVALAVFILIMDFIIRSAIDGSKMAQDIKEIRKMMEINHVQVKEGNKLGYEEDNKLGDIPDDECPNCHAKVAVEDRTCPQCGLNLKE
jgi:hypothetical protein